MYPEEGDFEEVYSGAGREDLVDNDEISASEEAFMAGYDEETEGKDTDADADEVYDGAFSKKKRRSKRRSENFDEEDLLNDIEMR
jgi:hypothetical protein